MGYTEGVAAAECSSERRRGRSKEEREVKADGAKEGGRFKRRLSLCSELIIWRDNAKSQNPSLHPLLLSSSAPLPTANPDSQSLPQFLGGPSILNSQISQHHQRPASQNGRQPSKTRRRRSSRPRSQQRQPEQHERTRRVHRPRRRRPLPHRIRKHHPQSDGGHQLLLPHAQDATVLFSFSTLRQVSWAAKG